MSPPVFCFSFLYMANEYSRCTVNLCRKVHRGKYQPCITGVSKSDTLGNQCRVSND